ncbi:MAG: hypothetical protein HOP28_03605 [Gemmatimonadales bacterium]|nr:hypothetical protein [Gemmatimonadales bacterium]
MHPILVASLAALGAAATLSAQQDPKPRPLGAMIGEFPQTFSNVRGFASVGDGRLVVSDRGEQRLSLIEFASGTAKSLSRKGGGPLEYTELGGLYHTKGGGVALYDQNRVRLLGITPTGELVELPPIPTRPGGRAYSVSDRGPDLYTPDSLGQFYWSSRSFGMPPNRANGEIQPSPGLPVLRIRSPAEVDTVAMLRQPPSRTVSTGPGMTSSQTVLYSPVDLWALSPDGWLAVVRSVPYRVEWHPPRGAVVQGPVIPYTALRVTDADRAIFEKPAGGPPQIMGARTTGEGVRMAPVGGGGQALFADAKPAFPNEQVPLIDHNGRLWVERYTANQKEGRVYDVFDRAGALADRVLMPAGVRLVGFDRNSVYGVRADDDDLLHLQRFRLR